MRAGEGKQLKLVRIFNATLSFNKFSNTIGNTIQYQKEPKFHGIYSRNNLPETKDGTFVINIDEFKSTGTNLIALKCEWK